MLLEPPRLVFIYGTLRSFPLLAWVLTGDASKVTEVSKLVQPASIRGYARFSVKNCDYPAVIEHEPESVVDGYLLRPKTICQRRKLDDFEGETYQLKSVSVTIDLDQKTLEADVYLWAGDKNQLTNSPWELEVFEQERLEDWLELFGGFELLGDNEE